MEKLTGGGGGREGSLGWPATAATASPWITMEIHISDRTHKFQNKTGLDAKDNSELYKSKQVNSVVSHLQTSKKNLFLESTRLLFIN